MSAFAIRLAELAALLVFVALLAAAAGVWTP